MNRHEFIFTRKKPQKYYRHITFWLAQYLFWGLWAFALFYPIGVLLNGLLFQAIFLPVPLLFTYLVVYRIFPNYVPRRRYYSFVAAVSGLAFLFFLIDYPYFFWRYGLTAIPLKQQVLMSWYIFMNFIISGPPIVCATFLTIKMLKNFYEKTEEKQQLLKENANAELQLLKARVHPHFLFNTLNNIYSFSLSAPDKAKRLVRELSDTLRYMVYECEQSMVPLPKELKLLNDYIALEKIRYGDRLKITTEIEGDSANMLIAPLLMIPFVENCFKHGTSQMVKECWVSLRIEINDDTLLFELSNSKPVVEAKQGTKGIGLSNVKKRLELIYPDQYTLQIVPKEDSYHVYLQLQLVEAEVEGSTVPDISTVKNYQYA